MWTCTRSGQLYKNLPIGVAYCNPSYSQCGLVFSMWRVYLLVIIIGNHMAKYRPPAPLICCTTKEHLTKDTGKLWSLLSITEGFGLRGSCDRDVTDHWNTFPGLHVHHALHTWAKRKWVRTLSHSLSSSKMWSLFYQVNRENQSTDCLWVFSLKTLKGTSVEILCNTLGAFFVSCPHLAPELTTT